MDRLLAGRRDVEGLTHLSVEAVNARLHRALALRKKLAPALGAPETL
jgi:hypothetical protein